MRLSALPALTCAALLVACGSGSPETTASTAQELVGQSSTSTTCPTDYIYECETLPGAHQICGCVLSPTTPFCTFDIPAIPAHYGGWIESWAVASPDGQCPDIPGSGGTWKQLDNSYVGEKGAGLCFDGVPDEYQEITGSCAGVAALASAPCCTYVWWPTGYVLPTNTGVNCTATEPDNLAAQDQAALCTVSGQTFYALEQVVCDPSNPPKGGCPHPGGGGCGTCANLLE